MAGTRPNQAGLSDQARMDTGADKCGRQDPDSSQPIDYRDLFKRSPDAVIVVDRSGGHLEVNQAACELTGHPRAKLLGMSLSELLLPPKGREHADLLAALRDGNPGQVSCLVRHKDGAAIPVLVRAMCGGPARILEAISIQPERAPVAQVPGDSDKALYTLAELSHNAIIGMDASGRITSWNHAAHRLLGYSNSEAMGLKITKLIPVKLRPKHNRGMKRLLQTPQMEAFERTLNTMAVAQDGSECPVEVSIRAGRDGNEHLFCAVIRDLSEHHRVVHQLNDALQRLKFHIERMPLAYILWDLDFRVVEWNPAAEQMFGYSSGEAIGKRAYDLVLPPDAVETVSQIWSRLLEGDTSSHSINPNIRKDGSRLTCEWFNTPLLDASGSVYAVASMAMDISEREVMETQIRNSQKLESLGVLASGIAHDFNSLLMVMLGRTALLRSIEGMPEAANEHLDLIEESGFHANDLIKHLLDYARTGRHNPQPTDLNLVVKDALRLVAAALGREYQIDTALARRLPSIAADRSQLERIVANLCLNAREAMPSGGVVSISTRKTALSARLAARCLPNDVKPGTYVELTISDSGTGMDKGTMARIFDPFFTTRAKGHGLGLAAVLGILRQHRGAALVASQLGKGTTMRVFLPVEQEPAPRDKEAAPPKRRSSQTKPRTKRRTRS